MHWKNSQQSSRKHPSIRKGKIHLTSLSAGMSQNFGKEQGQVLILRCSIFFTQILLQRSRAFQQGAILLINGEEWYFSLLHTSN